MRKNEIWVIGAGFVRSLGGPLLSDLFSYRSLVACKAQYGATRLIDFESIEVKMAHRLYHWGTGFKDGKGDPSTWLNDQNHEKIPGLEAWQDAEGYLCALSRARLDPTGGDAGTINAAKQSMYRGMHYEHIHTVPVANIESAAKKIFAAECLYFCENASLDSEAWRPYVRWAESLRPGDVIITFNYDPVLEMLGEHVAIKTGRDPFFFALPQTPFEDVVRESGDKTIVLKLHGSTDWILDNDLVRRGDRHSIFFADPKKVCIGTPGDQKLNLTEGGLASLWLAAKDYLAKSSEVIICGYRFPPSDSEARHAIISALRAKEQRSDKLNCRLVLGNNRSDEERICALLKGRSQKLGSHCEVTAYPLRAEEFI